MTYSCDIFASEGSLNLELISNDHALIAICREIAKEYPEITWTLTARAEPTGGSDVGICLWDYKRGMCMPENVHWGARHFALVDGRDLDAFRSIYGCAEPGIVLKPVTRPVV